MSSNIDRIRANEAAVEAAITKNHEKVFGKQEFSEMDWIKLNQEISVDRDTGKYYDETNSEKFNRKFGNNPFILIGSVATGFCLTAGIYGMLAKNSNFQQKMMRGRVIAQGFTFGAIGIGLAITLKNNLDKRRAVSTRQNQENNAAAAE